MSGGAPSVGIVGGGLAGLAAAVVLCEAGNRVELFEAKRQLGGRAGSFTDPATGETIDHCQHVAMGCCTAFLDLCRRTNIEHLFRRDAVLHFFSPEGRRYDVRGSRWLPAPLHLLPSLLGLGYLSLREKLGIARAMWKLLRWRGPDDDGQTVGQWLRQERQLPRAIERFWAVVLVSALGESVERASLAAARKVFVDGFLAERNAWHLYLPTVPLSEIYERGIGQWLREHGARIHLGTRVAQLTLRGDHANGITLADGAAYPFDLIVLATPWNSLAELVPVPLETKLGKALKAARSICGSPITSLHLWFDRPLITLDHAVLVGRLSQWVFARRGDKQLACPPALAAEPANKAACGYQVVISASHALAGRAREDVLSEVLSDLAAVFPDAKHARLLHWRMITQHDAVFSYRPGLDGVRPAQTTPIENLFLAGDWTSTGWPATMESAVRSGFLAAQGIIAASRQLVH